tara:strand:+ start:276 stop:605 length:330 start_codon:yes stop_codon:yes gene_type:complete
MYKIMVDSVGSVGKKGVSVVARLINSNRTIIEGFLVFFIVVHFLPRSILGVGIKGPVVNVVRPVINIFRNDMFLFLMLVILLYACCIKKDMNLFMLLVLFLLVNNIHQL